MDKMLLFCTALALMFSFYFAFVATKNPLSSSPFTLTSPAFLHGQPIPDKYSCKGAEMSPPLAWTNAPAGTKSFALIMDDPDAKDIWIHWVVYKLPAHVMSLPEGANVLELGGDEGATSWPGKTTYGGMCPPSGTHRYLFKLYALDSMLALTAGATKEELLAAMKGHILAQAELMGTFTK